LFLGGWRAPWPLSSINDGMFNEGWWPLLWFLLKLWLVMFFFVWVRATLLRFRYDQFMHLGWKVLIPVALAWVVGVGVIQGVRQFTDISLQTLLFALAGALVVFAVILLLLPEKKTSGEVAGAGGKPGAGSTEESEPFDPYAGGYPVPPLPGQTLPPSPRKMKVTEPAAAGTSEEEGDG